MPRVARIIAPQYPHHITQRGNNRTDVFFDDDDKATYLSALKNYSEQWSVKLWAYCLMTNHVHLLAVPEDGVSLSRCIGRTNLLYTQHINRKYNHSGRLWQNRFFSTIIETESYLWAVARYIEQNPVKAKLIKRPHDYHWSSCRANISGMSDGLVTGEGWLDEKERGAYEIFLMQEDPATDQKIRVSTSTGRPLGSESFTASLEIKLSRKLLPGKAGRPKKPRII
ncbi:MAG: transposase [Pseudomonadota bacterium]